MHAKRAAEETPPSRELHATSVRLVLASASPRRRALLPALGLSWRAAPQGIDEQGLAQADPLLSAIAVAVGKVRAAAPELAVGELAVGADTIVVLNGAILGKPVSPSDAMRMLEILRARTHQVLTGVALQHRDGREWAAVVSTTVRLRAYSEAEVAAYVQSGLPLDKAGSYGIQDRSFQPVEEADGCWLNVVGLPLCAVSSGPATLGVAAPGSPRHWLPPCALCRTSGDETVFC